MSAFVTDTGDAAGGPGSAAPRVSVIIKCLNEEKGIEAAITSALHALDLIGGGEVIVADSRSTDATVALAKKHPVRIVQLRDEADRSCAAGAQLGMQYARGEFVYVLDGDMQLMPDFLAVALQALDDDPRLAGVAGLLREAYTMNYSSAGRERRRELSKAAQTVVALDGGALYRRAAIEEVRYLANPSLHAFEEFDLGARLVSKGWKLRRLDVLTVLHKGYTCASIPLMVRRWRTRYAWGHGELLRAAIGQPHLRIVLAHLRMLKFNVLTVGVWMLIMVLLLAGASAPPWGWILAAAVWPVVWAVIAIRRRSASSAAISLLAWHVALAGLVCGFLARPRRCPDEPLSAVVIR